MAATLPAAIGLYWLALPAAPDAGALLEGLNPLTGERRIFALVELRPPVTLAEVASAVSVYESARGPLLPRVLDHGAAGVLGYVAFETVADARPLSTVLASGVSPDWALRETEAIGRAVLQLHRFGLPHARLEVAPVRVQAGGSGRVVLPPPDLEILLVSTGQTLKERLGEDARAATDLVSQVLAHAGEDPDGLVAARRSRLFTLRGEQPLNIDTLVDALSAADGSLERTVASSPDRTEPPRAERPLGSGTRPEPQLGLVRLPGRYGVIGEIARGGMGVVLEARDRALRRDIALKVLLDGGSEEARARFIEEAQVQGQLEHPNICPVHELAEDLDGQPYFTMKRVRGEPLSARLRRIKQGLEPHDLNALLGVFVKACDAVAFAHSRGVLHRDLKPANIMTGEFGEVQVMDWGIAKVGGEASAAAGPDSSRSTPVVSSDAREDGGALTRVGSAMGTPHYMPPEQFLAAEAVDQRGDIYALGAILYEILTLTTPVDGDNLGSIVRKVQLGQIEPPSQRTAGRAIPRDLELATMKALALRREERHPSVLALRDDVQAFLDGRTMSSVRYSPAERLLKWSRRNRALVSTAALALLVLAVASTIYVLELQAQYRVERQRVAETLLAEAKALTRAGRLAAARTRLLELEGLPLEDPVPAQRGRLFSWTLQEAAPDSTLELELGFRVYALKAVSSPSRVVAAGERLEVWPLAVGASPERYTTGDAPIRSLDVSPRGELILTGDEARRVSLYDAGVETPRWSMDGVDAAALLWRSGRVACAQGRVLRLIDPRPEAEMAERVLPVAGEIDSVVVDPGESIAVVRYQPRHLAVVRLETWTIVRDTVLGSPLEAPLALSPGHHALVGRRAGSSALEVLSMNAGARLEREQVGRLVGRSFETLIHHEAPPTSIEFSQDGARLLVGDQAGQALLWSRRDRRVLRTFASGSIEPLVASMLHEEGRVVGVTEGGRLLVWPEVATPGRVTVTPAPLSTARAMAFSGDGAVLWVQTVSDELVDTHTGELFGFHRAGRLDMQPRDIASLRAQLAESAEDLAVGAARDGSALVRVVGSAVRVTSLVEDVPELVRTLPADFEAAQAAVGPGGAPAVLFGMVGPRQTRLLAFTGRASEPEVWAEDLAVAGRLVLSPQGDRIAFGGRSSLAEDDGRSCVVLLSRPSGRAPLCLEAHSGQVNDLAFGASGDRLYSGGDDGRVVGWDLDGGGRARWTASLGARVRALAHNDGLGLVFAGLETGHLVALSADGTPLLDWSAGGSAIVSLATHADGRLAVASADPSLQIVDPAAWLARSTRLDALASPKSAPQPAASSRELQLQRERSKEAERRRREEGERVAVEALAFRGRERELGRALEAARRRGDEQLATRVMHAALRFQNDRGLELALVAKADANQPDSNGVLPIATAWMLGRSDYADRLVAAGARPEGGGALSNAAAAVRAPWTEPLPLYETSRPRGRATRRARAPAPAPRPLGPEVVGAAVEADNLGALEMLLRGGFDLSRMQVGMNVEATLAHVVRTGRHALAIRLLAAGLDPQGVDEETTALVEASRRGEASMVQLLVAHGADPNRRAPNGLTPLTAAFLSEDPYPSAKRLLLDGADPNLEDAFGRRPLELALGVPDASTLRALLTAGADGAATLAGGDTALHRAAEQGRSEHLRALLAAGVRPRSDAWGRAPPERASPRVRSTLEAWLQTGE